MNSDSQNIGSTKPYLIRALYEWCTDNGLTPYLAVQVGAGARVPMEFVKNGEIVLNISFDATSALNIGNDEIRFKARFGGVARDILIPIGQVSAIYARENSQGMAFPVETADESAEIGEANNAPAAEDQDEPAKASKPTRLQPVKSEASESEEPSSEPPPGAPRPGGAHLTRVK
ncbi:ClpXP protease specificity-enhancing factor [Thiomonas arsenitoxydans]|uniref:ClpXP protease specificity-enhancing factor n=1 Tax=Thiomonas arsenitoxydans (strain DSM 22701 / CIP 110005 / 3As) TaxID=426114 RepID=UPI001AC507ED|nr:ClpXP protease specificity-enhancing factor [Thiomonas arsenitoxydans]MBN8775220.1 ClpXP protease specificity-enhancing factor [Thiomonas arsenitoxydans]